MGASMTSTVRRAVGTAIQKIGQGLVGVACSGGADSMALADAAIDAAGPTNVVVIAIDHGLQAETARVGEAVAGWARQRGAAGVVERVVVEPRASVEAAAREARYAALDRLAERLGVVAILTGHTARDQAETVLMRIVRGTGPAGLAGIPARRDRYVRPLLGVTREDIEAYVAARGLPVWNDPMNDDAELMRTRIRGALLPALRMENPQLDAALVRLAAATTEWLEVIDAIAAPLATLPLDVVRLQAQPPAIRKRAIALAFDLELETVHLDQIDALICAPTRGEVSLDLPGARIVRSYDAVAIATPAEVTALAPPDGPYALRVWQPGDRMKPARLRGRSRKLSDLFGDAKVPRSLRATARVVVRLSDGEIVWAEHLGIAHEAPESVAPKPIQMGGSF